MVYGAILRSEDAIERSPSQEAHSLAGTRVFVVGEGNSAGQAAVFFSNYAAEVIMLVRATGLAVSMSQYLIAQIAAKSNIRIESWTEVTEVLGGERLERDRKSVV